MYVNNRVRYNRVSLYFSLLLITLFLGRTECKCCGNQDCNNFDWRNHFEIDDLTSNLTNYVLPDNKNLKQLKFGCVINSFSELQMYFNQLVYCVPNFFLTILEQVKEGFRLYILIKITKSFWPRFLVRKHFFGPLDY